jgi:hypothetical protein
VPNLSLGVPGVSMDELVGICTKLAREMDAHNGGAVQIESS